MFQKKREYLKDLQRQMEINEERRKEAAATKDQQPPSHVKQPNKDKIDKIRERKLQQLRYNFISCHFYSIYGKRFFLVLQSLQRAREIPQGDRKEVPTSGKDKVFSRILWKEMKKIRAVQKTLDLRFCFFSRVS